jgi:COP9 signalosome complex subunit 5
MEKQSQRIWDSIVLGAEEVELFKFDEDLQDRMNEKHPWDSDVHFFKKVKISSVALIKMVMHAISGGNIEIMGLMQGKVVGNEIIVLDAFGLPVEGTETRVNASAGANEYMVQYVTSGELIGKREGTCGWYHSHPGYGCWLSGIDVSTQKIHQQVEDPYLAIVIDPIKTLSSGKVEIGCFRTYPEDRIPEQNLNSNFQNIPLNKIEDFGVHYKCYYQLEHSFFKSSMDSFILDCLYNKYWTQTLSSTPLLKNKGYSSGLVFDIAEKISKLEKGNLRSGAGIVGSNKEDKGLSKIANDAASVGIEQAQGLTNLLLKNLLFYERE